MGRAAQVVFYFKNKFMRKIILTIFLIFFFSKGYCFETITNSDSFPHKKYKVGYNFYFLESSDSLRINLFPNKKRRENVISNKFFIGLSKELTLNFTHLISVQFGKELNSRYKFAIDLGIHSKVDDSEEINLYRKFKGYHLQLGISRQFEFKKVFFDAGLTTFYKTVYKEGSGLFIDQDFRRNEKYRDLAIGIYTSIEYRLFNIVGIGIYSTPYFSDRLVVIDANPLSFQDYNFKYSFYHLNLGIYARYYFKDNYNF